MKVKTPKEDPADKAARLRDRRTAELELSRSTQTQARDMTSDIRRTYGNRVSMFGLSRPVGPSVGGVAPVARPTILPTLTPQPFVKPGILGGRANK